MDQRVGVWLVGANGLIGSTVTAAATLLARQEVATTGLLTANSPLNKLDFLGWDRFVFGGCDVVSASASERVRRLCEERLISAPRASSALQALECTEKDVWLSKPGDRLPCIEEQIIAFQARHELARVVVVDVSSTASPPSAAASLEQLADKEVARVLDAESGHAPTSLTLACAAARANCGYINFTPNLAVDLPRVAAMFQSRGLPHVGKDGRTGETLLKTVLAPMFAERQLKVLAWMSYNMLGAGDGRSLGDPANCATKLASKSAALDSLLPPTARTHRVSIDYVPSLGDWKTAWNFVHFEGFLDVPMSLQFTWQGCDTALAAPLVLDLIRFVERAMRHEEVGHLQYLDSYFKTPAGARTHDFRAQTAELFAYAARQLG